MITVVLLNIGISVTIYILIVIILIAVNGKSGESRFMPLKVRFDELDLDYTDIPPLVTYKCRDGSELNVRHYSAQSNDVLVLIHGSGWHSRYFLPMARFMATENLAQIYTPDLRGHGEEPSRRGDIDYINQLEDDLADLIAVVKKKHPGARITLGGHSSGGGLVVRFGGGRYRDLVDSYLLLTPYLKYNAPTIRPGSGGWAYAHLPRIIGLSMLNNIGIRFMNSLDVIDFNMPEAYRDGTETLSYSHRLNTGFAPRNYKKDLAQMRGEMLVLVGTGDESNNAAAYPPTFTRYRPDTEVRLLEGVTHMGLVVGDDIQPILREFFR